MEIKEEPDRIRQMLFRLERGGIHLEVVCASFLYLETFFKITQLIVAQLMTRGCMLPYELTQQVLVSN